MGKDNSIIVQPLGGLCNRMRAIVGALSFARKMGNKVKVLWAMDSTLNAHFSELFEDIPCDVIECELDSLKYKMFFHWYKDIKRSMILDDAWISDNARGKKYDIWKDKVEGRNLFLQTNLDILLDGDYSIFKAKESVVRKMNNVVCDKNTIGLHIRRTDNAKAIKYSPTHLFFEKVEEELSRNPQMKFYLATDDPQEESAFVEKFGSKVLIYNKHSLDRNNPLAIKDALIDLYNLSHCQKIYGSYWSSFSDTAALWSGIEKIELKESE
ncbi:MAG: hypothetical protein J5905_00860 [Prevotella sp.]|nr:hypothetical protein [Prevotella sp.]